MVKVARVYTSFCIGHKMLGLRTKASPYIGKLIGIWINIGCAKAAKVKLTHFDDSPKPKPARLLHSLTEQQLRPDTFISSLLVKNRAETLYRRSPALR